MYKVQEVAKIAGVSVRTLHHYDSVGLLKPSNIGSNRYRYYNDEDLKLLQHILFFKELGFSLKKIQEIVAEGFDPELALAQHASSLRQKQERLDKLIANAEMTLFELRGEETLTNEQRFAAFANEKATDDLSKYRNTAHKEALVAETIEAPAARHAADDEELSLAAGATAVEVLSPVDDMAFDEESDAEHSASTEGVSLAENSTALEKAEAIEDNESYEEDAFEKEEEDLEEINREGNRIYRTVASLMHLPAASLEVQREMAAYYHLLNRFYECNPKMFRGLGDLYATDRRFSTNIDQHGQGLSTYLKDAMYIYADGLANA
ncbi:MerR family transcriptional regulator [Planococcus sp. YIM B11945]|uniref:MerR family transcriptional regulator n=1 Tax=Planococcus sp. YIM B11945 TaxID=3435410 RepID=UPI003D7CC4EE